MKTYSASSHRCYPQIVELLGKVCCYLFTASSFNSRQLPDVLVNQDFPLKLESGVTESHWIFRPHSLLQSLSQDSIPEQLSLSQEELKMAPATHRLQSAGHKQVLSSILASSFLVFYESLKPEIYNLHGRSADQWPEFLNFARVVRNACGHGGIIKIDNPHARTVEWKGISYSAANNGRTVFFNDLSVVDVVFLMEELDSQV